MSEKEDKYKEELKEIPEAENKNIQLVKIEDVAMPHLYCITPKHLEYSDSMHLDIAGAEKKGAVCEICREANRKNGAKILKYDEHETSKTLFIRVPQNRDLNAIEGLHAYLLSIKPIASKLGITGFAFPT